ncbi:MAG: hypothetical protein ABSF77_15780 [Spirochaetia bacterium]|jgi:hypothetical protein
MDKCNYRPTLLALLFVLSSATAFAQSVPTIATAKPTIAQVPSPLSLEVRPGFDIPLGDNSQWFSSSATDPFVAGRLGLKLNLAPKNYEKLKAIDPTLAGHFAFLGEGKERRRPGG